MSATLRDIAQHACVSASTVSRVLNNYPYVDEKTREVVLEVADALGYERANLRRPMITSRSVLLLVRLGAHAPSGNGSEGSSLETGLAGIER